MPEQIIFFLIPMTTKFQRACSIARAPVTTIKTGLSTVSEKYVASGSFSFSEGKYGGALTWIKIIDVKSKISFPVKVKVTTYQAPITSNFITSLPLSLFHLPGSHNIRRRQIMEDTPKAAFWDENINIQPFSPPQ